MDLPLSADGDTGYGNAINVFFTVRGFEAAGVDGLMLEDQVWRKRCGHMAGKEVISAEERVEKIRAAVEPRRDPDFIIMARTDAMATQGVNEAIRQLSSVGNGGGDPGHAQRAIRVAAIGPGGTRNRAAATGSVVRRNQRADGFGYHQADGAALPDRAAVGGEVWEGG
jgi:Phosphoenolpyruvate phosphomutase